jgi:histidine decarboxylase
MSEAVDLASCCPIQQVVATSSERHAIKCTDKELRSQCIKHEQTNQLQLAPYQALPVAGPVITHHRASAVDVMEPSPDLPDEVRYWMTDSCSVCSARWTH